VSHQAPQLVVVDRDGTLIRHIPYLCDPAQVSLLPGVRQGLERLREAGCRLFLHTNQSGVGRGYFPLDAAIRCNDEMLRQLDLGNALFEEICICPEAPNETALYRKPSPKFGLELLARYSKGARDLCYIGDNLSDLMTAVNIGCHGVGVNTGVHDLRHELAARSLEERFQVRDTFGEAVDVLLAHCAVGHD
jgi:D-glycero-D-manno-heptose 1,7-bisphosphate phosphatase